MDLEIPLEEAQNLMGEILEECVEVLRNANLITLAEELGFNVEQFSKISSPDNSAKQPQ